MRNLFTALSQRTRQKVTPELSSRESRCWLPGDYGAVWVRAGVSGVGVASPPPSMHYVVRESSTYASDH